MRVILKYKLFNEPSLKTLDVPAGSIIRSVGLDGGGNLCMWVEVEQDVEAKAKIVVFVVATGARVPDDYPDWVGTVLDTDSALVWHVYARYMDPFV